MKTGAAVVMMACVLAWALPAAALPTSEYIPDVSTIALYHFNTDATDAVGNHNGTLLGNAAINTTGGRFGGGLELDGDGDYARLGNVHQNPSVVTSLGTVEAWVKLASAPSYFVVLGSGTEYGDSWDDGFFLGRHADFSNKLVFGVWAPGWAFTYDSTIAPESLVGQWHHLAGTWGPEGVELWVDGIKVGSNSYAGGLPNPYYATALVGTDSWMWETPGMIDEVRISSLQRDFSQEAPIPEPATMLLLGFGLTGIAGLRRRMHK